MTSRLRVEVSGHALLITGSPGAGKTTAVRRIAASLPGWRLAGFFTEELRMGGARLGFRAVTVGGIEQIMAHVDLRGPCRVGKYGVDLSVIDRLVDSELAATSTVDLYVVDEIGKMECCSEAFVSAVRRLLASPALLLATIARRGGGLIAEAKTMPGVQLWELTRSNRDELPHHAIAWLQAARARWRTP